MSTYIKLRININQQTLDIQSKEAPLITVLNKIKDVKKLDQTLYAIQNYSLIDETTLVSQLQGDIDVITFPQLLNQHKNLIENGKQIILPNEFKKQQQEYENINQQLQKLTQENLDLKNQISDLLQIKALLFNEINYKELQIKELKHLHDDKTQLNIELKQSQQLLLNLLDDCSQRIVQMEQSLSKFYVMLDKQKEKQKNNEGKLIIIQEIKVSVESMIKQKVNMGDQQDKLKKQIEQQNEIIQRKIQKQHVFFQEQKQQHMLKQTKIDLIRDDKRDNHLKLQNTKDSIDICIVIDFTQSMEPFKESVIKFLNQTHEQIRKQTSKECNWGIVAYKDIDYLQATRNNEYPQQDFNKNIDLVCQFIENQEFSLGDDTAEDLQQGLKQALTLSWKSYYKVVLVITDAPCHGLKYHNGEADNFPDKTIEGKLEMLLQQKIFIIGIQMPTNNILNDNKKTKKMFEQFQKYFEEKGCLQIIENMFSQFTYYIKTAAQSLSQVTIKNTILQDGCFQRQNIIYGAVESISKKILDPIQFDKMPDIKIRKCKFTVHRSEFKQVAFDKYIKDIHKLGIDKDDYNTAKEDDQWNCIISQTHVAEGLLKKVYLMKNRERDHEVYIVKSPISGLPYQSFDAALRDCRSHLIAKLFIKRFKDTFIYLREEKRLKIEIPQIQYSDFLILEEDGNQFWIAERYFKGEFVKYNNNNGFIDDSKQNINHLLQAFSIFTYFESETTMMICDIQGVGQYLTDPAINTNKGGFDITDIGEEGINNFLINFKQKKIGIDYLDLLDIQLDKKF